MVTLDGPAGAGKGTVSTTLARDFGCNYLESGALYRIIALLSLRRGVAAVA